MRQGEIFNLRWEDVNFKNEQIWIRETKNGSPRHVPMTARLREALTKRPRRVGVEYIFWGRKQDHRDHTGMRESFVNLLQRAGIENFTFHDLRHNADSRIMPTRESRGRWDRGIPGICHRCRRHNQRDSRKASSVSLGLYHPGFTPIGVVLERASCFNRRSAWRYICVVSTDS